MWNSLELKNIAWIYSCIITDISLMYTALDFYLWRGSIWVFILTIMDKTSSRAPQQKLQWWRTICQCRHYWRQNQTEDGGIWWVMTELTRAQSWKLHAGTYRSRLWQRDKETDRLVRDGSGDAMIGGQSWTWLDLVLLHIVTTCCWSDCGTLTQQNTQGLPSNYHSLHTFIL